MSSTVPETVVYSGSMHTHIGAIAFVTAGLYLMLWLTLWRLLAMHGIASNSSTLNHLGQAMLVQG